MPSGSRPWSAPVSRQDGERKSLVGAAGRTAFALLRTTGRRAKIGALHLPIALHPHRQEPEASADDSASEEARSEPPAQVSAPPPYAELRALRSRLAVAERRNARLRFALQQQRLAMERLQAAYHRPATLIEHLISDLAGLRSADRDELRRVVVSALAAYGFEVDSAQDEATAGEKASAPGFDRRRTAALVQQLLEAQPEIGSARYVHVTLEALGRQGELSLQQLGAITGMSSPVSRRRLRLTVEALCQAGAACARGGRYSLVSGTAEGAGG